MSQTAPSPVRRPRTARRVLAVAASLGLHLLGLSALLLLRAEPPRVADSAPLTVALVEAPPLRPAAPAPAAAPAAAARAAASPLRTQTHRAAAPPDTPTPAAASAKPRPDAAPAAVANEVGEAELAGAATAGSGDGGGGAGGGGGGGGGGACDMARRLQEALAKDPLVRAAVASGAHAGRALRVWDGDWVANPGEDGRGLAAVREAIMWEVGFSPKACREAAVRGLVLVSLADLPGAPRLVLGVGRWRWSDLLTPRSGAAPAAAER